MDKTTLQQLTAYVDGELSPVERQAVEQLLRNSPEARHLVRRFERDAARLRGLVRVSAPAGLAGQVMARVAARTAATAPRTPGMQRHWVPAAVAAAIVIGVGLGTFAILQRIPRTGPAGDLARQPDQPIGKLAGVHGSQRNPSLAANRPVDSAQAMRELRSKIPSREQVDLALEGLRETLKPLVNGVTDLLGTGPDAVAGAFAPPSADDASAGEGGLTSPTFLTSQLHPSKAFKSITLSKMPLFLEIKELDGGKLHARLREDALHHVDLSCQESWKSLERLQAACRTAGVKLVIDAEASQRQAKKLPASYLLYLENVSPELVVKLLRSLQAQELAADQQKKGDTQFGSIMVSPLDEFGRKRLAESLGVSPASLVPAKKKPGPAGVDPTKPLTRETEKALDKLAAGQGAKPAGKEPTAVVLVSVPNRSRVPVSKEVKAHLDARDGLRADGVGVVFVLRSSRG